MQVDCRSPARVSDGHGLCVAEVVGRCCLGLALLLTLSLFLPLVLPLSLFLILLLAIAALILVAALTMASVLDFEISPISSVILDNTDSSPLITILS